MTGTKIDLHIHSKFSKRPSSWILQKIGCQESYTSPKSLYETALKRGMDYVTITDHNLIDGALEIAHLPNTFISEEITTYFPHDKCKIHVLAWNINEKHHQDILRARESIFDLVDYLNENNIPNGVAHPLYSINDRLTLDHFEKLLILFRNFELNGTRDRYQNIVLSKIIKSLTPGAMERLQDKHNIESYFDSPWKKQVTGGSDDHSSLNIASKYTEFKGEQSLKNCLVSLGGKTPPIHETELNAMGEDAVPAVMAHNLYSIIYQFYKTKIPIEKYIKNDPALTFIEEILTPSNERINPGVSAGIKNFFARKKNKPEKISDNASFEKILFSEAKKMLQEDSTFSNLKAYELTSEKKSNVLFHYIEQISNRVLRKFADQSLLKLYRGNFLDIFQIIGSATSLYAMLSPYFIGYGLFTKDRDFCDICKNEFLNDKKPEKTTSIGYFTDTFEDINGVARTLEKQLEISKKMDLPMEIIACSESKKNHDSVSFFKPVGKFEIPSYEEIKVYYPPFLKILDHAYSKNFSHIHAVTPGPIGLAALAVSKILKKPIYATYHTAFPEYVKSLTDDDSLEEMAWKYMVWFYNQMDAVYTPSKAIGRELAARGINKEKIVFYPRGIDIEKFHPDKKDIIVEYKFKIPLDCKRILYAGRLSKEKNLDNLVEIYKKIRAKKRDVHLIIAGDGPYKKELQSKLNGQPATFTGFINQDELSAVYAASDVFVFPSTTDTFGNVVLEAQASGVPVVVTDRGGPMENLVPGKTGYIIQAEDIDGFTEKIIEICTNNELLMEMKQNARQYMETRSFDCAHQELWKLYDKFTPNKNAA